MVMFINTRSPRILLEIHKNHYFLLGITFLMCSKRQARRLSISGHRHHRISNILGLTNA